MGLSVGSLIVSIAVIACAVLPSLLLAQSPSSGGETAEYGEAISSALAEFDRGNYAESREHFRVAHELAPSARTMRGLGIAEFELRNYPDSVRYLEHALASSAKPLTAEMRQQVEEILYRARGYVGEVAISFRPANTDVTVNGEQVEIGDRPLLLPVGDHVLEFSATGYVTQRRSISVKGRGKHTIEVVLASLPTRDGSLVMRQGHPTEVKPVYARWWFWTTVGVIAAGGAITAALLMRARNDDASKQLSLTPNVPPEVRDGLPIPAAR